MSETSLTILDYDEVGYELIGDQLFNFKKSFAAAACALIPELKFRHAFRMAIRGWRDHTDATSVIVNQYGGDCPKKRQKLADDIDRLAHRLVPTDKWKPIDGLAAEIQRAQSLSKVVIWTHGHKGMVLRTMDKLGLYGLVSEKDIYDKGTHVPDTLSGQMVELGRKDADAAPYQRICAIYGIKPENATLVDDTPKNLAAAHAAGIGRKIHIYWNRAPQIGPHITRSFDNTRAALQWLNLELSETKVKPEERGAASAMRQKLVIPAKPSFL